MKKILPILIAAVVAGGGGFFAGTQAGSGSTPERDRFQFSGDGTGMVRQLDGTGALRQGMNGGLTGGEVLSIDGTSMTVKVRDGGSKVVLLSSSTKVSKMADGTLGDVVVGGQVTVTGSANDDGSITAESIQVRPGVPAPYTSQ